MKKKSSSKFIIVFVALVIVLLSYYIHVRLVVDRNSSMIYPGVDVNGINISYLSKDKALLKLKDHFNLEVYRRNVTYIAEEKEFKLKLKELNPSFNYDKTIDLALGYGKNLSTFKKYSLIKKPIPKSYQLVISYDLPPLKTLIRDISTEITCDPVNATIRRENSEFKTTEHSRGKKIDIESVIDISLAQFNKNRLQDVIIQVPIDYTEPGITTAQVQSINSVISSFTTNLSGSSWGRVTNVKIATNKISNKLVMPGEEFSFNSSVGQINTANGYQTAKVIMNNKLVPGVGGGVCQVSSTLYNAMLKGNIIPTERHHHTLPSSYVPIGLDATISSNYLDYKFVNTLGYPVLITGYVSNNKSLTFNVYSNDTLANSEFSVSSDVTSIIPNKVRYIKDSSMNVGTQIVESKGTRGYRVNIFLIKKTGGAIVDKTLLYKDYYAPVEKVIKRGTKSTVPTAIKFESRDPFKKKTN